MKKNHPQPQSPRSAVVRLIDIGPRIEFFPNQHHFDFSAIQRQAQTAFVSLLTAGLVLYLTIGQGLIAVNVADQDQAAQAHSGTRPDLLSQMMSTQDLAGVDSLSRSQADDLDSELLLVAAPVDVISAADANPNAPVQSDDSSVISDTAELSKSDQMAAAATVDPTPVNPAPVVPEPTSTEPTPTETAAPTPTPTPAPTPTPTPTPTNAPAVTEAAAPSGGMTADQQASIIELARSLIGTPYVLGGTSSAGIDCSGFTLYVYRELFDIELPHKASGQTQVGSSVSKSEARIGDILCFDWDRDSVCDHVAIYIGDNHYVNASRSRGKVVEQTVNFSSDPIVTIRRLIG